MRNTSQHGSLLRHSGGHSPHISTSRISPGAIPRSERLPSAMSPRMSAATENASDSQIYSPPRLSGARHIPLPPTVQGHVELNPLLHSGRGVLIRYRLVAPPTAASAFGTNDHWMLEAATRPHLRSMTIITSGLIPWPIIVHASNANHSSSLLATCSPPSMMPYTPSSQNVLNTSKCRIPTWSWQIVTGMG
ncbi:hypothetical protein BD779DRAFT_298991 [Infundibulicybe gibba]|nr:hypothetical protein BD779DRAFT_298991 [Infundibulicybe gibba]